MTFTPTFGTITSGQVIIPGGIKAFTINVVSGAAYAQNTLLNAGTVWSVGMGDSKLIMSPQGAFALGATGAAGTRVTYLYIS